MFDNFNLPPKKTYLGVKARDIVDKYDMYFFSPNRTLVLKQKRAFLNYSSISLLIITIEVVFSVMLGIMNTPLYLLGLILHPILYLWYFLISLKGIKFNTKSKAKSLFNFINVSIIDDYEGNLSIDKSKGLLYRLSNIFTIMLVVSQVAMLAIAIATSLTIMIIGFIELVLIGLLFFTNITVKRKFSETMFFDEFVFINNDSMFKCNKILNEWSKFIEEDIEYY